MTKILDNHLYKLNEFQAISKKINDCLLPDEVIKMINDIALRVGAPEYQKTPVFSRRERNENRPSRNKITPLNWEEMRNFKPTKLSKSETPFEKIMDNLRLSLNKMTESNFVDIKNDIIKLLQDTLSVEHSEEDLVKIGSSIFEIGSMNKFWTEMYAKLYKDLIDIFPVMYGIYERNFERFGELFDNIRYVSAEEDYDLFCDINKENDRRRSMSSFFVNLMKHEVVSVTKLGEVINNLVSKIKELIVLKGMNNQVDEIGENIFIMVNQGHDILETRWDDFKEVKEYLKLITNLKKRDYPSLSNKTIFKFMDLKD